MTNIRVRFAPSPTGPLHLGGVRTALYNYLFAKKNKGIFILRIEDTDQNRFVPGAEKYIMDSLAWCGIKIDEGIHEGGNFGPYKQSERKILYKQYADTLIQSGHAYYAFDTPEELEQLRKENSNFAYNVKVRGQLNNSLCLSREVVEEKINSGIPYVIRIKVPAEIEIKFDDIVRGAVSFHSAQVDDKVMFKSDGMPTYHLANVVDDYLMKITHVIRGEEWLPSTPIHVLLYEFLGWSNTMPQFAHLPLILKPDGNGKLSKRDGDRLGFPVFPLNWMNPETGEESHGFKERGFLPEAFVNFLALLGWNPGTEQEILSIDELVKLFNIEKLHKSGAKFDFEKAKWVNASYIKKMESAKIADYLQEQNLYKETNKNYLVSAIELIKERLVFLQDIQYFSYLFNAPQQLDETNLAKLNSIKDNFKIDIFEQQLESMADFNLVAIETFIKSFANDNQIKVGEMMKFLRISLVGELSGPAIPDLMVLIGKKNTIERIKVGFHKYL